MDKEYLIKKWLIDDLTEKEFKAFRELDDYAMHVKILEGAQSFKSSEVSEIADFDTFYARVNKDKSSQQKLTWYKPFFKLAALVVVSIGVGSLFFFNNTKNIETQISQKFSIALPDASTVMVNSMSELTFNKNNWKKKREVTLKGEAFFNVVNGSTFDVITESGKVSVLGTQFNVKSRKGYFEVQCFEGLVNVEYQGYAKNLPAGGTFKVINGSVTSSDGIFDKEPNWINNISSFKSAPFYQVVKEFERQYAVVFSMQNIDTSRIFTGGFVHTNLEDGLKSITLPLDLKYTIDSESRITIYKSKP